MSFAALRTELAPLRHHAPSAGLVALSTAALVVGPRSFGVTGLLITVALLQIGLIAAWSEASGTRGYLGSVVIGVAAAAGADAVLYVQAEPDLAALVPILAGTFVAGLVYQLTRPSPRRLATASLASIGLLGVTLIALSAMLALYRVADGATVYPVTVAAIGAAVLAGHVVDLLVPRPPITPGLPRGLLGLLLSVGAGVAAAVVLTGPGGLIEGLGAALVGAILGLISALLAIAASFIVAERPQQNWALPWLQAVLPLAGAAPIAYFLALRVLG